MAADVFAVAACAASAADDVAASAAVEVLQAASGEPASGTDTM